MGIRLLGTLDVVDHDGAPIDIGGSQPRVILALLVAADGNVVAVDALVDAIWDDAPPVSAAGTLQTYVSRLRRALEPVGGTIVRAPAGYRLEIDAQAVDVHRFEALADEGRALLDAGDVMLARSVLVEADRLWRGPALLEVRDRPRVGGIARRLDERRLAAIEDRINADLTLGRHAMLAAELAQLVSEHPLREGFWELLALARYRSGMQAEALRAISQARETLVDALGVEPGAGLRKLEQAILAQDPDLDAVAVPQPRPAQPRSASPSTSPQQPPIIGREAELAALELALDEASAGRSCIAVVQGEAGVGKTRLVEELAATALQRGARVVWGRAVEGGAAPPYWSWRGVLRALRAADPDRGNDAVDQLLDEAGSASTASAAGDRAPLLDGVVRLLEPDADELLVIIIEDVQWADAESLELTMQIASSLDAPGVLIVLTLRDGDDARRDGVVALLAAVSRRGGACRLHVEGLEPAATAALLTQVSGHPVDECLARVVHDRAEGNPFYAIELQRLLDADGVVDAASVAAVAVPVGVRDVVRQRLSRLPPTTLEVLHVAAVAGRDLDVELISAATGRSIERCLDELDIALEHRLLSDAGAHAGLRFTHALVREVLVDELSSLRQARLHLTIADAIVATGRGEQQVEILAEHLWAAVPIAGGRRAADALDRAAEIAIGHFAVSTACDLLGRSLELRQSCGNESAAAAAELDTLVKLVWALRARGGYQGGLDHYARGAELARRLGRHEVELEMHWAEWAGHSTGCDLDRARPIAERFQAWAADSDDNLVKLAGLTAWAIQCWHDGDLSESAAAFALAAGTREAVARDAYELSLAAELVVLSTSFGLYLDEQLGTSDDPDGAFAGFATAVDGNFPEAIVWSFACSSAASTGDRDRLERYARRVVDAEAGETLGFWGSQARMYLGAALTAIGQLDEGRKLFDVGRRAYVAAGMHTGLPLMLATAASAEVAAGDLERASGLLASAQDELGLGERWPIPFVLLAAADVAEASGASTAEVVRMREHAEEVARSQGAVVAAARARSALPGEGSGGESFGGLVPERARRLVH